MQHMDDLTFGEKLKIAVNTDDVDELLRVCCDSSDRKNILEFKNDNGHCLLHLVVGFGTVDLMRTLIDLGAGVTEDYCNHKTILQTACCQGNTEVVRFLLQNDKNLKNDATRIEFNNDKCLYYYAARSGNIETIQSLQHNGHLDINQIFPKGSTALLKLVKKNDCKGIETLCLSGADVNIGTINKTMYDPGYKAIHLVSEGIKNGAEMIQILLKYGANVNEPFIRSKLNQQPLFMAIKVGHVGNAKVLLEHGADISFKGKSSKETIGCFCLAIKKCPSLVSELIKRGANLYERHNKKSVLMIALDSDAGSEAIEALVKAGANVKFGRDGKTVIQCCTRYDQLKSFLNAGISVENIESIHKISTVGLALKTVISSFSGYSGSSNLDGLSEFLINNEISELVENEVVDLISNGADPDMLTKEHEIPLIMAIEKRMKGVFKTLIDAGANTNKLGKDGNSAIHLCCIG
ncbi:ankyrin repeat and KH domain-containing protein 1-like [Mytilus californianus]|uniref:ankyrin repeat and KH domain-containing protein 1-like n=1 Tax=Mytilus californianus TaxID=6549 RepID=UPI002246A098|nr:ankyrin repeat and KH domain-containing protein 1-like [Mytilus californianus]